jgi:hypothetical protein
MGGAGFGSLVDAGPVLLALTPKSELIVFEPNPAAYTEKAKVKVAGSPTYSYPVISGKQIYVKDKESLSALSIE